MELREIIDLYCPEPGPKRKVIARYWNKYKHLSLEEICDLKCGTILNAKKEKLIVLNELLNVKRMEKSV